jgi:hypothetical protein
MLDSFALNYLLEMSENDGIHRNHKEHISDQWLVNFISINSLMEIAV